MAFALLGTVFSSFSPREVLIHIPLTAGQGEAAMQKRGVIGLSTTTPLLSSWHNSSGVSPLAGHCYLHTIAENRGLINCSSEMLMNVWVGCVGQKIICGEIHKTSGICKCFMMTWLFSKHSHLLTNMSHESLHTGKTSKPLTYSSPSSATLTAESIHWPVGNRGFRVKVKEIFGSPMDALYRPRGRGGGDMAHCLFWVAAHRTELGLSQLMPRCQGQAP